MVCNDNATTSFAADAWPVARSETSRTGPSAPPQVRASRRSVATARAIAPGPVPTGGHGPASQLPIHPAATLGPDQNVQTLPSLCSQPVIEVGLAVGHDNDHAIGGQVLGSSGQRGQPALTLLVGSEAVTMGLPFAQMDRTAPPDLLMEQTQWHPSESAHRTECSHRPEC
jgi:hypothetical protein